jgi:serine/threonine protein kinase
MKSLNLILFKKHDYNNIKYICSYSFSADYFSLGCFLYELVRLKNPFADEKGKINVAAASIVYFYLFYLFF